GASRLRLMSSSARQFAAALSGTDAGHAPHVVSSSLGTLNGSAALGMSLSRANGTFKLRSATALYDRRNASLTSFICGNFVQLWFADTPSTVRRYALSKLAVSVPRNASPASVAAP